MDEVRIPDMGDHQVFRIKKWYKNDGDRISRNEKLCEIETNVATMELESLLDGYL